MSSEDLSQVAEKDQRVNVEELLESGGAGVTVKQKYWLDVATALTNFI